MRGTWGTQLRWAGLAGFSDKGRELASASRKSRVSELAVAEPRPLFPIPCSLFPASKLFTQVPPGEFDKDRFQAWLGDLQVSQAVGGGGLHQIGEQAVGAGCDDSQAV